MSSQTTAKSHLLTREDAETENRLWAETRVASLKVTEMDLVFNSAWKKEEIQIISKFSHALPLPVTQTQPVLRCFTYFSENALTAGAVGIVKLSKLYSLTETSFFAHC